MVKIADIGDYDTLPPLAAAVLAGDTAALDGLWAEGFDLDAEITLSQYKKQTPLALALVVNARASLHWLIRHGVDLNRLLRLSGANGDDAHLLLVWNPATACIGYWDLEHEAYGDVASFADFMASPSLHLDRVLDGGLVTYGGY